MVSTRGNIKRGQLLFLVEGGAESSYLSLFPDGLVNDVVILHDLLLHGILQVLQARLLLLQVYVAEASVEEDLARVELEEQAELRVIDHVVSTEVEEGVVKVGESLLEIA